MASNEIDIIIPVHNDSEHLLKTMASCYMQDVPINIIVVDDYSDDENITRMRAGYMPFSTYVRTPNNVGLAGARNFALKYCHAPFFIPLDTMDYLYPNVLGAMLRIAKIGYDVVFGNCTERSDFDVNRPPGWNGITRKGWLKDNQIWCTSLYRRENVDKVGQYDDSLKTHYEDYEMNVKLWLSGARFIYIDRTIYRHTYNSKSMLSELHKNTNYYKELARKPLYEKQSRNMGA